MDHAEAVRELLQHQALRELLSRLSRGVDRADRELIVSCYTPDGRDEHGLFSGTGAEFADWICDRRLGSRHYHHQLGSSLFRIEGDRAVGETSYTFHRVGHDDSLMVSFGRYLDRFRRGDDGWRIEHRQVVAEWMSDVMVSGLVDPVGAGFPPALLSPDDPVDVWMPRTRDAR